MSNIYQSTTVGASPAPAAPEQVLVSLGEIAESAREGLLALAVGTGLQVMYAMMDADVAVLAGPKGKHQPDRVAVRHGTEDGSVTLGGRRLAVRRPRVRAADGSGEVVVSSYELFAGTEVLGRMAMERMLAGLSTRRYRHGLEPVGETVAAEAAATSRSAVSRRFVAATEHALAELMGADLSTVDLVVLMVDGVHFAEHTCVVALGIGIDGTKHPLALVEGSTENATLVTDLLVGLRERGLDVTRPILAVLDGSKALSRAVRDVFDQPVIQRCQQHRSRKELMRCFRYLCSLMWYGDHGGGPVGARLPVRGVVAASERAAAAFGGGCRGPVARPRRGTGRGPGGRDERDHCAPWGGRVGGGWGSVSGRSGPRGGWRPQAGRGQRSRCAAGSAGHG